MFLNTYIENTIIIEDINGFDKIFNIFIFKIYLDILLYEPIKIINSENIVVSAAPTIPKKGINIKLSIILEIVAIILSFKTYFS